VTRVAVKGKGWVGLLGIALLMWSPEVLYNLRSGSWWQELMIP